MTSRYKIIKVNPKYPILSLIQEVKYDLKNNEIKQINKNYSIISSFSEDLRIVKLRIIESGLYFLIVIK